MQFSVLFVFILTLVPGLNNAMDSCHTKFKVMKNKGIKHLQPVHKQPASTKSECIQQLHRHKEWRSASFTIKDGCVFYNQSVYEQGMVDLPGNSYIVYDSDIAPNSCKRWLQAGYRTSTTYPITQNNEKYNVFCDMETDGGGWMVFQRRMDGSENFYRNWAEYAKGFGNLLGEHWLGNNLIHKISTSQPHELRVDLENFEGGRAYAKYGKFYITSEADKFTLFVSSYNGTAGDSLIRYHNGMEFTTMDRDNDKWPDNCAVFHKSAWWYNACHGCLLNGYRKKGFGPNYIVWRSWNDWYGLSSSKMMMRPIG